MVKMVGVGVGSLQPCPPEEIAAWLEGWVWGFSCWPNSLPPPPPSPAAHCQTRPQTQALRPTPLSR